MPDLSASLPPRVSGKRIALAIVSWVPAFIGIGGAMLLAMPLLEPASWLEWNAWLLASPLLAWLALGVMTVQWIRDRRTHRFWPIAGAAAGLVSAVFLLGALLFYASAMPLAFYLFHWHLLRRRTELE